MSGKGFAKGARFGGQRDNFLFTDKRALLENLRWKKDKAQVLREQIAELEEMLECVPTSKLSDMPRGAGNRNDDHLVELLDKKEELRKRYVDEMRDLLTDIKEAEEFIAGLPERYQVFLKMRFISGKTWFEIADATGYDVGTIFYHWRKICKLMK